LQGLISVRDIEFGRKETYTMRVHQNQVNPYAQLDAMHAAHKASAKREAERTRKKLFEIAAESAGEGDSGACAVSVKQNPEDGSGERQQSPGGRKKQGSNEPDGVQDSISDWA
jgi:hypothetical protein